MAQYSKSRKNKQKPQKNDDIYEVILLGDKDGNIINTHGQSANIPIASSLLVSMHSALMQMAVRQLDSETI